MQYPDLNEITRIDPTAADALRLHLLDEQGALRQAGAGSRTADKLSGRARTAAAADAREIAAREERASAYLSEQAAKANSAARSVVLAALLVAYSVVCACFALALGASWLVALGMGMFCGVAGAASVALCMGGAKS